MDISSNCIPPASFVMIIDRVMASKWSAALYPVHRKKEHPSWMISKVDGRSAVERSQV
jgi:hypothetical protein